MSLHGPVNPSKEGNGFCQSAPSQGDWKGPGRHLTELIPLLYILLLYILHLYILLLYIILLYILLLYSLLLYIFLLYLLCLLYLLSTLMSLLHILLSPLPSFHYSKAWPAASHKYLDAKSLLLNDGQW